MKVLHLIPSISPQRGGPSQAVLAMVAALRGQGIGASILTTNDAGPGIDPSRPLGHWHPQHIQCQSVPVLAFPRWSPPVRAVREFAVAPGFNRWLEHHAGEFQLVHVHSLFSCTTSIGMAQLRRQGVPYIVRPLGHLSRWSLSQSRTRKQLFLRVLDRANLQAAAALHFTSAAEQAEAADLGLGTPAFVLPLGVPDAALPPRQAEPEGAPVRFLFLSRLHPKKQLSLLLEALALLLLRQPQLAWQLHIAGDGEPAYINQLQLRSQALGIAKRLYWHGFVAGAAKQALLQQADWFVLPSASENFGIAAAEALMAGTPVVLSPGVAIADAVQTAGAGKVCEASTTALAACLEQCLNPPSPTMRQAAHQLACRQFSWPAISTALIHHYEEILRG